MTTTVTHVLARLEARQLASDPSDSPTRVRTAAGNVRHRSG